MFLLQSYPALEHAISTTAHWCKGSISRNKKKKKQSTAGPLCNITICSWQYLKNINIDKVDCERERRIPWLVQLAVLHKHMPPAAVWERAVDWDNNPGLDCVHVSVCMRVCARVCVCVRGFGSCLKRMGKPFSANLQALQAQRWWESISHKSVK